MKNTLNRLENRRNRALAGEYDEEAAAYDKTRFGTPDGRAIDEAEKEMVYSEFEKIWARQKRLSKITILEVGCGTGRFLRRLSAFSPPYYVKLHGVDPSREMRRITKNKVPTAEIINGTVEKIPFKNDKFDLVFCMHVFMHLNNAKKGINEMYRVAKKGGMLIADFPNRNSPWTIMSIILNPFKKRTRLFTIKQLKQELKEYHPEVGGLFSYSRIFYKMPVVRDIALWLEKNLPLSVPLRRQIIIKIEKT